MSTRVFLTIDTEFAWRHHVAGYGAAEIYDRSLEPAGVGLSYQLRTLAKHGLKAVFFVDPMPAIVFGPDPVRRMVAMVLDAGQEVQLHCHPNWSAATRGDRGVSHARFELIDYSACEQQDMLARAVELLVAAGAPAPIAFRAGSYSANDDTLAALVALGFAYDSSHNGAAHPWPSAISLSAFRISPVVHHGLIEVPVTVIEDVRGALRTAQICALSSAEMRAAIDHAVVQNHALMTIVGHSFELANRAGTRANRVHVDRFKALCALLADRAAVAPTTHFADRPQLALDRDDRPLGPDPLRRRWRQVEQLWSNLVEERAA